jgi:4-hydroxy-3-methylbut-2-enyl diphosphate reductase
MLQVLADWSGPVVDGLLLSAERVVTGRARRALAANGALAVDMETSAWVEALAGRRLAVVRVVADGPDVGMVRGGLRGLRTLRRLRPLLERWAGDGGAPH